MSAEKRQQFFLTGIAGIVAGIASALVLILTSDSNHESGVPFPIGPLHVDQLLWIPMLVAFTYGVMCLRVWHKARLAAKIRDAGAKANISA